MKPSLNEG